MKRRASNSIFDLVYTHTGLSFLYSLFEYCQMKGDDRQRQHCPI